MINTINIRQIVIKGLRDYLGCPVIRSNQNIEPPEYPYGSYTITCLESANNGTWQEHDDGIHRKAVTQTWSMTFQSDDNTESITLANKAREWLDLVGSVYLNDNDVIVQSVGPITNRDNFLTIEYEYRNGFDVVFWGYYEVEMSNNEKIGSISLRYLDPIVPEDPDKIISELETQIDKLNAAFDNVEKAIEEKGIDIPDDMSVEEYYKMIEQIASGTVDAELSSTSTNAVQNKVIFEALEKELDIEEFENSALENTELEKLLK